VPVTEYVPSAWRYAVATINRTIVPAANIDFIANSPSQSRFLDQDIAPQSSRCKAQNRSHGQVNRLFSFLSYGPGKEGMRAWLLPICRNRQREAAWRAASILRLPR
jgi:hypothetical protein